MGYRPYIARKEHRCGLCGRKIPIGARYWRDYGEREDRKEHTNCCDYEKEPELHPGFNQNRSS